MHLPKMKRLPLRRETVEVFKGYNHNLQIGEGEFFEMENMTSDHYPVLSPRPQRGTVAGTAQEIAGNCGLCRVENGRFYLPDGTDAKVQLTPGEKQLVTMGAYVIILPDKVWVNVATGDEKQRSGAIDSYYRVTEGRFLFQHCRADGTVYTDIVEVEPKNPTDGQMWIDTTGEFPSLKQWSETGGMWVPVATGHVRVELPGVGEYFEKGDSIHVRIEGIPMDQKNAFHYIGETSYLNTPDAIRRNLGVLEATWVAQECSYNAIIISGYLGRAQIIGYLGTGENAYNGEATAERKLPDMDFICESGNRLWGCKYGMTEHGFVNEIYASKLGDFKNFNSFQGISTDSYVASVGADGPFTGAISYMGRPVFFKENCMLEVSGSYPAAYQLQATPCDGVQAGSSKSLAIVDNVLYYKSCNGICAFDGSLPVQVGQALGEKNYEKAIAGSRGIKYYVSMYDPGEEKRSLFVYDTGRRLWHREDHLPVYCFCSYGSNLYALCEDGKILSIDGTGEKETEPIPWMVQTGALGMRLPDSKYISRLTLRLSMALGSEVSVYACYDSNGCWEHLYTVRGTSLDHVSVPLRPRRCDHMQLRLQGTGEAKLYSLTKTVEQGGEGI